MQNQPSYYAIIPAAVRYNQNLTANQKLLYGEITALSNNHGYCYATNAYFAKLYDVHKNTISSWISNLEKQGFLSLELIKGSNKQIKERRIFIADPANKITDTLQTKTSTPINEKTYTPINKKLNTPINEKTVVNSTSYLNNTRVNNTSKNKSANAAASPETEFANAAIGYLNQQVKTSYKSNTKETAKNLKSLFKDKVTFDQVKTVINFKVLEWGADLKMRQYLRPSTLFRPSNFFNYLENAENTSAPASKWNLEGMEYSEASIEEMGFRSEL